ncbi:S8 family serine peptidase [Stigmatella aurantiaca]|uniref:Peptidase, S8A (Subtilisin) subfamily n=2 Tax=Stigmatella aurantiaca (strain DW4/3-1) TaxID=378806 RepID=E3FG02_STIAD|nr:S8 family serine peptidase [Stigmatella aurantiaca]ADO75261.1 Peptidase, S8A (Subtilisin) subfamily [Stigmatella aurantiaca DW4/3-1]
MHKTGLKFFAGALTGLVLAGCGTESSQPEAQAPQTAQFELKRASDDRELIPGRYIVVFKQEMGRTLSVSDVQRQALSVAQQYGAKVSRTYAHALQGFSAQMDERQAEALRQDPRVAFIEQDAVVRISTDQANATWGLDRIDQSDLPLNSTYSYNLTGAGVNAYIIDTGIRLTHTDFQGRAVTGFDAVTPGGTANDCNGHGTHVAGTVGGATYGVAKGVNLHAVRVLDCGGSGTYEGVVAGVDWVTANHVKPAVANMSLGGSASDALDQAIRNSIAAGVVYAVAAGNDSGDACSKSPARTAEALTVGSTTNTDARSSFSNFGTCVDIFAPGSNITSTYNTSDTATSVLSGTSMASPHVAGVAALYLQGNPTASAATVGAALTGFATAGRVTSPGTGSPNLLLFSGFIQPGGDVTPPTVSLTSPTEGSSVQGTVELKANAADDVAVKRVEFWLNGQLLGSDDSAPYALAWDTLQSFNGTVSLVAKAFDTSFNAASSTAVSFTVQNPGFASYDSTRKAPICANVGAACDTGSLIIGRGTKGPELNAPNTIGSSCADGNSGTFHVDESLDRLRIATVDGGPLLPGKEVTISATIWAWSTFANDKLELFHTADANNPSWTHLGTLAPTKAGSQVITKTFTLPAGSLQAIRGLVRYNGTAGVSCSTGSYDDHDDLIFALGEVDAAPTAEILSPTATALVNGHVTITARATDDKKVDRVLFYVGTKYVSYKRNAGNEFSLTFDSTKFANGSYPITVRAIDSAEQSTTSQPVSVTIQN